MHFYKLYGLRLGSNLALPHLPEDDAGDGRRGVDLIVHWADSGRSASRPDFEAAIYRTPLEPEAGAGYFAVWRCTGGPPGGLTARFSDGGGEAIFDISPSCERVDIHWPRGMDFNTLVSCLLGPVMGCALRLRNTVLLHAGVIAVDGRGVAFIGGKGTGKSTLTAAFAMEGFPVVTDDIAPLLEADGSFLIIPGYPRLRLWSDGSGWFGLPADVATPVATNSDKRYFRLSSAQGAERWCFSDRSLPLAAIFLLEERCSRESTVLSPCNGGEAHRVLLRNGYADYAMDREGRIAQFRLLGQIAARMPICRVARPDGLEHLPGTIRLILTDIAKTGLRQAESEEFRKSGP